MASTVYDYILTQWTISAVDAAWVQRRVPKFITQEQCDTILATPQGPDPLKVEE